MLARIVFLTLLFLCGGALFGILAAKLFRIPLRIGILIGALAGAAFGIECLMQ